MNKIIGIDLGTTNSAVAVVDSGIPYVIADEEGQRLTPSVVYCPDADAPVVGRAARNAAVVSPQKTVSSVKRLMGSKKPVLDERLPEDISADILKHLRAIATADLGAEPVEAVITVPAYFNDTQRTATKRAGELAGLKVERIVNEPTAAALAYGLERLKEKSKVAVYDLGGGTFDLSILELNNGVFQVLSTSGNTRLGGDDIDAVISSHMESLIDGPLDEVAKARIREAAENAKIQLSEENTVSIALPFISGQSSFEHQLTRETLEKLALPIVTKSRENCLRSLADAKLESSDLDQVILVGGQTRMPLVRRLVAEWFQCAEFDEERGGLRIGEDFHEASGPKLNTSQNPDEAVALGAAIQGEILAGGFQDMLLLDVTPLSLGIETFGGLMNVIIPRNSTIPIKAGEVFTTAVDNQREMLIHVLQGEREKSKDNWSLGKFTIEFEKAPRAVPRVGVQYEIDANGILHVLARDIKTGKEKIVDLKSAVDVEDSDVQQMVEESVEHAFDDLRARQWVEAKLKAQATIEAAEKGVTECTDELPDELLDPVREATKTLQNVLAMEEDETGPVEQLKEAHAKLDEVSQPLAEALMERAMDEMLKRRGLA
ncbi:MAG: Hsp70 family protein [Limisphaerales bacterium]